MLTAGASAGRPAAMVAVKRLLPQAAFDIVRAVSHGRGRSQGAREELRRRADQVRAAFPDLPFRRARLVDTGAENVVIVLDGRYVFRFPRPGRGGDLLDEIRLLKSIERGAGVRVPDYRFTEPSGALAGYPMVGGRELQPALFRRLERRSQEAIVAQIGDFLNLLHAQPAPANRAALALRRQAQFSDCEFAQVYDFLQARIPSPLLASARRFFDAFGAPEPSPTKTVHSDLLPQHMLVDGAGRVGVIDFGDVGPGDPAWDFAVLGSYAPWVGPELLSRYRLAENDEGLLERAARQAVRFWFVRLVQRLSSRHRSESVAGIAAMLRAALERAGV
ncbi:MAG TPA: aminoglycoside phosphotransferase family protein [Caulobacteraceae bacterium]|nr:aminoglycoside phosphotransferase family protein [Caulobacteraceae bacterium]